MIGSLCSNESLCGNINLGDFGSRVDTANTPISLIWEFCATEFNYSEQVGNICLVFNVQIEVYGTLRQFQVNPSRNNGITGGRYFC